jgi:hypothetical protein
MDPLVSDGLSNDVLRLFAIEPLGEREPILLKRGEAAWFV